MLSYASDKSAAEPQSAEPLPKVLVPVLAEVKAGTSIPVLLPTDLPRPFSDAERAVAEKVKEDEYTVVLYFKLQEGDAGFAASFGAKKNVRYSPRDLPNVQEVKLAGGVTGFFRPVSCGGSCAPANICWEHGDTLYDIQLRLPPALGKKKQQKIMTQVSNSAILAGAR